MALSKACGGSDLSWSSESSEDSYRGKFETLKKVVKELQKELTHQKMRNEGVETLSRLLEESQAENQKLKQKNAKLETMVTLWSNRLTSSGHSTSESIEEEEFLAPGLSPRLMDNLIKQNSQLKQQLKYMQVDPSTVEQLAAENTQLKEETRTMRERNEALESENQNLRAVCSYPATDKEAEVKRLQQQVHQLEKSKETQEVLCQSLSEEAIDLKQKLQETAGMCQHLARKLEEKENALSVSAKSHLSGDFRQLSVSQGSNDSGFSQKANQQLLEENEMLKNQVQVHASRLQEAMHANGRWTAYNTQRDVEFKRLQQKLGEAEHKLSRSNAGMVSESQQRDIDRLLLTAKRRGDEIQAEKEKVEDENRHLRIECDRLRQQLARSSVHLRGGGQDTSDGMTREQKDRMHMLETQIQICTEDFEQERKDRERAQAKVAELEQELDLVKRQLDQFQVSHMNQLHQQRQAAMAMYQGQYHAPHKYNTVPSHESRLVARGPRYETDHDLEEDCIDTTSGDIGPVVKQQSSSKDVPDGGFVKRKVADSKREGQDDLLLCPKCNKGFPTSRHDELIEHMDVCCD